ncbi:MAG: hypothetical protein FWE37_09315 [Spirochaetaceae bacterium]|nr:hypothetical protein [Spirochaetaceae bacterium]
MRRLINMPDDVKIVLFNDHADSLDESGAPQIYFYSMSALDLLATHPNNHEEARVYFNLGRVSLFLNDLTTAQQHFSASYALSNNPALRFRAAMQLGEIALREGDYQQAGIFFGEALSYQSSNPERFSALLNLVQSHRQLGNFSSAQNYASEALTISSEFTSFSYIYLEQAEIAYRQNDVETAALRWQEALANATQFAESWAIAGARFGLARLAFAEQNWSDAIFHGQRAVLAISRTEDVLQPVMEGLLAEAYLKAGFTQQAFDMLNLRNSSELRLLRAEQDRSDAFFRNSIELSLLRTANSQLEADLAARNRFFFLLLIIGSALLVWSFILLQAIFRKEGEERATNMAYTSLANHSSKNHESLKNALIKRVANPNFNLAIISISFTNREQLKEFGNLALDYFAVVSYEGLRPLLPSSDLFIDLTRKAAFAFLIAATAAEFELLNDKLAPALAPLTLQWRGQQVTVELTANFIFFNNAHTGQELEKTINELALENFR